tara:strand:- start:177 stop:764 length:588 start_codon:yes stop_codon:yes gene_type:complete
MRQKLLMNKVCSINVGEMVLENKDFNGVIDSTKIISLSNIYFFYDDEDVVFAYGVSNDNHKYVVDICEDYGVADGETLRESLPLGLSDQINNILLASVDFDEIYDEGIDHCVSYPSGEAGEEYQYITESNKPNSSNLITVHSVFGQFLFDDHFSESILKKLKDGTLEDKLIVNVNEFGEIDSYDTETDMIVLLPN